MKRVLEDLVRWCEALAIVGGPTPEAWRELDRLLERARRALESGK